MRYIYIRIKNLHSACLELVCMYLRTCIYLNCNYTQRFNLLGQYLVFFFFCLTNTYIAYLIIDTQKLIHSL